MTAAKGAMSWGARIATRAAVLLALCALWQAQTGRAETIPTRGAVDSRIRVAEYDADEVYKLHGHVGYQIDLQFAVGETFVGLGAGDLEGLSFVAQDNHLFLKPKAPKVSTNLTVLTSRRQYQIDYTASSQRPSARDADVIYSLRFAYPPTPRAGVDDAATIEARLGAVVNQAPRNVDYWYCGHPALKPVAASDDGVHTRLRFNARAEQPAIFVRNDDGSESLLNFSVEAGDVIVHRVSRQLILRRGNLTGCIVNKAYSGAGARLDSGTIAPNVERTTQGGRP